MKVLLYSPDLDGHRQVYCERISRVLLDRGHRVVLAVAFRTAGGSPRLDAFEDLLREPAVSCAEVGCFPGHGAAIDARQLAGLIGRVGAQVTVLLEADDLLPTLCGQIGRRGIRLPGRRVGLFLRSTSYRYRQGPASLRTRAGWVKRLPAEWRSWPRLFHECLLPRYGLLDAALCLDECFVAEHQGTHQWMPDLFETSRQARERTAGAGGVPSSAPGSAAPGLDCFLVAHAAQEVFVYFGRASARRGYDTLLRLAERRGACLVHCGRRNDGDAYEWDVASLRASLARRGDLFETDAFVARFDGLAEAFAAAPAIVLPYRGHLGSSGVMLQTLSAGRPVLVPDVGLTASRVRDHRLGAVYRPCDEVDLERSVDDMWGRPPAEWAPALRAFLESFSPSQVTAAVVSAVEGGRPGAVRPGVALSALTSGGTPPADVVAGA